MGLEQSAEDGWPQRYDPHEYKDVPQNELNLVPYYYPCCGLYHTLGEIRRQWPQIITMPIETQSEYADAITRRYALNPYFKNMMGFQAYNLDKNTAAYIFECRNVSAIANMAFIALANGRESTEYALYNDLIAQLRELYEQYIPPPCGR